MRSQRAHRVALRRAWVHHLGALMQLLLQVLAQLQVGVGGHVLLMLLRGRRAAVLIHVQTGPAAHLRVRIAVVTAGGHLEGCRGGDSERALRRDCRGMVCGGGGDGALPGGFGGVVSEDVQLEGRGSCASGTLQVSY